MLTIVNTNGIIRIYWQRVPNNIQRRLLAVILLVGGLGVAARGVDSLAAVLGGFTKLFLV
jgi:hypothetical protein